MLIPSRKTRAWLEQTCRVEVASLTPDNFTRPAINLSTKGKSFISEYGRAEIECFVGFVDLAGFSSKVSGKRPEEIAAYVKPFLSGTIKAIAKVHAMVDRTIGDEVMFALPEFGSKDTPSAETLISSLLGDLHQLALELKHTHQFRIGLSQGTVLVDQITGDGYSEWTLFGEPIHVAKRVMDLPELEAPSPVAGALGLQVGRDPIHYSGRVEQMLSRIKGTGSAWDSDPAARRITLKGVGEIIYGCFEPVKN